MSIIKERERTETLTDPAALYLNEIDQTPLLTREEEVKVFEAIDRSKKAEEKLAESEENGNLLTPEERKSLEKIIRNGKESREIAIKANTRFVVSIAKRYLGCGLPFLDLVQEGNLGLIKAVEDFDLRRRCKFSTYARWWIRQTISRAIDSQGHTIRVPTRWEESIVRVNKVSEKLEQELGREPTPEEMAEALNLSLKRLEKILTLNQPALSLEKPLLDHGNSTLGDIIKNPEPGPEETTEKESLSEKVNALLMELTPREEKILVWRFGLDGKGKRTLREVEKKFGLGRERIRQIEAEALERLRHPRRAQKLQDFY